MDLTGKKTCGNCKDFQVDSELVSLGHLTREYCDKI